MTDLGFSPNKIKVAASFIMCVAMLFFHAPHQVLANTMMQGGCGFTYRFCDGSAPEPPRPGDSKSFGTGYIDFTPNMNCNSYISSPGGGGVDPQYVIPIPNNESVFIDSALTKGATTNFALSGGARIAALQQGGQGYPPCSSSFPSSKFATGSNSDFVLGSKFHADPTWPSSTTDEGWIEDPDYPGRTKVGLAHKSAGTHVVATTQRLANLASRSAGIWADDNSNSAAAFCYISDALGSETSKFLFPPEDVRISARAPFWALVTYTRESACISCLDECEPRDPIVVCDWGGNRLETSKSIKPAAVKVKEFSPVVQIWDGVYSVGEGAVGDYNIRMGRHEYYHLGYTFCNYCL